MLRSDSRQSGRGRKAISPSPAAAAAGLRPSASHHQLSYSNNNGNHHHHHGDASSYFNSSQISAASAMDLNIGDEYIQALQERVHSLQNNADDNYPNEFESDADEAKNHIDDDDDEIISSSIVDQTRKSMMNRNGKVSSSSSAGGTGDADNNNPDIPTVEQLLRRRLSRKEKDLLLAAELGKALLDKNEQLVRERDATQQALDARLEQLEQERHNLKRRLDSIESEHEARISELQQQLDEAQNCSQQRELSQGAHGAESARLISELSEQNDRLTRELKRAQEAEQSLVSRVQKFERESSERSSSTHQYNQQLQLLKAELTMLHHRREELENRVRLLYDERDTLVSELEEARERVELLQRAQHDQEQRMMLQARELAEMRQFNSRLEEQLDDYKGGSVSETRSKSSNTILPGGTWSLYHELEGAAAAGGKSHLDSSSPGGSAAESMTLTGNNNNNDRDTDSVMTSSGCEVGPADSDSVRMYANDMSAALEQLERICSQLVETQQHEKPMATKTGDEQPTDELLTHSTVEAMFLQLKSYITDISRARTDAETALRQKLMSTQHELDEAGKNFKLTRNELSAAHATLADRREEIALLKSKLTLEESKVKNLEDEAVMLRAAQQSNEIGRDEAVRAARADRDAVIARQNELELELTRLRMDVMTMNQQLMDAVQQKIDLSQQLEAWQADMAQVV